jgi:nucleoid-associated protein YgaU
MGQGPSKDPSKPPREEDDLQPGDTGTPLIRRDITGEIHPQAEPEGEGAGVRIHIVREGETLEDLSRRYYGDPGRGRRILGANLDQIDDDGRMTPGTAIRIPPD